MHGFCHPVVTHRYGISLKFTFHTRLILQTRLLAACMGLCCSRERVDAVPSSDKHADCTQGVPAGHERMHSTEQGRSSGKCAHLVG